MLRKSILLTFCMTSSAFFTEIAHHSSLRSHNRHLKLTVCSADRPDIQAAKPVRRDILKFMIASSTAPMLATMWSSFPISAQAYTETKEELIAEANFIVKALSELERPVQLAETLWAKNKTDAQQSYNELHRSFSAGSLSRLRVTCFHLYHNHVTEDQKFKAAEAAYKDLIRSLERINKSALLGSRGELDADGIKGVREQLGDSLTKFRAFLAVVA